MPITFLKIFYYTRIYKLNICIHVSKRENYFLNNIGSFNGRLY